VALLPGPEYPAAHGSGAGDQGKVCPKPAKSFREKPWTREPPIASF